MKLVDFTHLENWHMKDVSTTMSVIWPLLYTRVVNFNEEHTVCKYTLPSWKQDRKGGINGGGGGTGATTEYWKGYNTKGTESCYLQKAAITVKVAGYFKLCSN